MGVRGKGWMPEPLPPHLTFLLRGFGGTFLSGKKSAPKSKLCMQAALGGKYLTLFSI